MPDHQGHAVGRVRSAFSGLNEHDLREPLDPFPLGCLERNFDVGRAESVLFKNCDNRHRLARPAKESVVERLSYSRWGRKISGTIRKPTLSSPLACMMCPASHPGLATLAQYVELLSVKWRIVGE